MPCSCNANCSCNIYSYNCGRCTCHTNTCTCNNQSCTCQSNCTCYANCPCNCNNCASNDAPAISLPWTSSTYTSGVQAGNKILLTHLSELYTAINNEYTSRNSPGVTIQSCTCNCDNNSPSWTNYNTSKITYSTWSQVISNLRLNKEYPSFTLSITQGGTVKSTDITTLRNQMLNINALCWCNCNRGTINCTCNSQYCTCNTACTCASNCVCNCDYYGCTCSCNY